MREAAENIRRDVDAEILSAVIKDAAPRVTPADIEAEIASEHYFTAAQGFEKAVEDEANLPLHLLGEPDREPPPELHLLTFCVLVLRNGCKVVGINHGPVDPANFDAEHGRRDAREDAIRQVWPLLGFRLRDQLSREQLTEWNGIPLARMHVGGPMRGIEFDLSGNKSPQP